MGIFAQAAYGCGSTEIIARAFVRWERYDMGSRYAGTAGPVVPSGLVPLSATPGDYGYWPRNQDRVWTVGANFYTTPHVVSKSITSGSTQQRFQPLRLRIGLNF